MCGHDEDKVALVGGMHSDVRRVRRLIIDRNVPNVEHIDGARDFFIRRSMNVSEATQRRKASASVV